MSTTKDHDTTHGFFQLPSQLHTIKIRLASHRATTVLHSTPALRGPVFLRSRLFLEVGGNPHASAPRPAVVHFRLPHSASVTIAIKCAVVLSGEIEKSGFSDLFGWARLD